MHDMQRRRGCVSPLAAPMIAYQIHRGQMVLIAKRHRHDSFRLIENHDLRVVVNQHAGHRRLLARGIFVDVDRMREGQSMGVFEHQYAVHAHLAAGDQVACLVPGQRKMPAQKSGECTRPVCAFDIQLLLHAIRDPLFMGPNSRVEGPKEYMRAFSLCFLVLTSVQIWASAYAGEPPLSPDAAGLAEPRPPVVANAWKKVKDIDQVIIERAESNRDKTPWSRGSAHIAAPFEGVVGHILDFSNLQRLVPKIIEARVLAQIPTQATVYYRLDLPWPMSDRHWTVFYHWRLDSDHFTMAWSDANQHQPATTKKAVLIEIVRGTWELWRDADGGTRAQLVQLISLGGSWIPRSVIEETVWKQPLETFRGMRRALGPAKSGIPGN